MVGDDQCHRVQPREKRSLVVPDEPGSCYQKLEYSRVVRKNKVINYIEETVLLNCRRNSILK